MPLGFSRRAGAGHHALIIALPPHYVKSICASVAFPAWVLGQDPTRRLICVSYSQDLARKHALDTGTVMLLARCARGDFR
ncbi:MAG: hypothetical protein ACRDQB_16450 [Thermocrispum sp.]